MHLERLKNWLDCWRLDLNPFKRFILSTLCESNRFETPTPYELAIHSQDTLGALVMPQIPELAVAAQLALIYKFIGTALYFLDIRLPAGSLHTWYTSAFLVLSASYRKKDENTLVKALTRWLTHLRTVSWQGSRRAGEAACPCKQQQHHQQQHAGDAATNCCCLQRAQRQH